MDINWYVYRSVLDVSRRYRNKKKIVRDLNRSRLHYHRLHKDLSMFEITYSKGECTWKKTDFLKRKQSVMVKDPLLFQVTLPKIKTGSTLYSQPTFSLIFFLQTFFFFTFTPSFPMLLICYAPWARIMIHLAL